jgi:hypothetical protein
MNFIDSELYGWKILGKKKQTLFLGVLFLCEILNIHNLYVYRHVFCCRTCIILCFGMTKIVGINKITDADC